MTFYLSNCVISDTLKIVNINQPIRPLIIAKQRGIPFIGISPNPKVVKVFKESIRPFSIFTNTSNTNTALNAPINNNDFHQRFLVGNSC